MEKEREALARTLHEMYPEIMESKISLGLSFDELEDAWLVELARDGREVTAYLKRKDAEDCMNGLKCESLGIEVGEFIRSIEKAH
ncbi:MAG: hypothetical protein P8013_06120 [Candidatus Sulfobium sp.]|jgi:hypothetical protein